MLEEGAGADLNKQSASRISEILPGVISSMGLEDRMEELRLIKEWQSVVGKVVAERSHPREIRNEELIVAVDSNVWMQELWFRRQEILKRIGELFPRVAVKSIRFELDRDGEQKNEGK